MFGGHYRHIVLFYNDRMEKIGKPKRKLREDEKTKNLREHVEEYRKIRRKYANIIGVFRKALKGRIANAESFEKEIQSTGSEAQQWWDGVDWRHKPPIEAFLNGSTKEFDINWGKHYLQEEIRRLQAMVRQTNQDMWAFF